MPMTVELPCAPAAPAQTRRTLASGLSSVSVGSVTSQASMPEDPWGRSYRLDDMLANGTMLLDRMPGTASPLFFFLVGGAERTPHVCHR
jgi:hypothetical protein